ncbi:GTPase IMAP family member 8-like [Engraulis encrasicolus]|uniref:GTPase IMAP family member 8-like n=1 Tax=Engraulis encrasicolus TaxID=184585 RepID=UPI002FD2A802
MSDAFHPKTVIHHASSHYESHLSPLDDGPEEIRIVLIGQSGSGKSATGNTILQWRAFEPRFAPPPVTLNCIKERGEFEGWPVAVVDTPGDLRPNTAEMSRCISFGAPGPHAFLFVVPLNNLAEAAVPRDDIQRIFGEEALDYTMVLFTHGDDLMADRVSIYDVIDQHPHLSAFINRCGGGYHVFNNRDEDPSQVRELLEKIYTMALSPTQWGDFDWPEEMRIVLIGQSGVGKSSTGNTILRWRAFGSSTTPEWHKERGECEGRPVAVVDSPGCFNPDSNTEISKCTSLSAPGPHAFLVVIHPKTVGRSPVHVIQMMFGEEALHYTMVLFTHGDDLETDGDSIQVLVSQNPDLRAFIRQCGGGYHVFNKEDKDRSQVKELLEKINTMVQRNGGSFYTNEMFREAERSIREEVELLRRENANVTHEEARRQAERDNKSIHGNKTRHGNTALTPGEGVVLGVVSGAAATAAIALLAVAFAVMKH